MQYTSVFDPFFQRQVIEGQTTELRKLYNDDVWGASMIKRNIEIHRANVQAHAKFSL
jgi:hypothetical protein